MASSNLPTSRDIIIQYKVDNINSNSKKKIINAINKFSFRYRLAKSFNGAEFEGFSSATQKGYNAGLQIMLCYSAYETALVVEEMIKGNKKKAIHEDNSWVNLAEKIRTNKNLERLLNNSKNVNAQPIKEKLLEFYSNKHNHDIILIAQTIRHTFAHGDFTAGGAGLDKASNRNAIIKIAEKILKKSDSIIRECLPELRDDFQVELAHIRAEKILSKTNNL